MSLPQPTPTPAPAEANGEADPGTAEAHAPDHDAVGRLKRLDESCATGCCATPQTRRPKRRGGSPTRRRSLSRAARHHGQAEIPEGTPGQNR